MAMIVVFSVIKELAGTTHTPGVEYPLFLALSFVAYNMFKNIVFKSMDAFSANKALFVYKQVLPFDTLISRFIIEISLSSIVFTLLLFIGWYIGLEIRCDNILGVLLGFLWIAIFGFSLGIFFAVLSFFYENFGKVVKLIFLPMFFLSALFYSVESLPPFAREIIVYNPVVNFMELIHGEFFLTLDTFYVDYMYMVFWTLVPLFLGLWLYKSSQRKIIMS